jgi:hypothetical protein
MEILDGEALRRIEAEMASRAAEPAAPAEPDDPDAEARAAAAMGLRAAPTVATPAPEKRAERDGARELRLLARFGSELCRRLDPRTREVVSRHLAAVAMEVCE